MSISLPTFEQEGVFDPYMQDFHSGIYVPAYEGASTSYRIAHRTAILSDADALAVGEMQFLQSRCRHMIRNNPTAKAARDKYVRSLGAIKVRWTTKEGETHVLAQDLWDEFADNPMTDGKGNFESYQATINGDRFESGEGITRMVVQRTNTRIPLKLQGIESEYLDIAFMGLSGSELLPLGRTRYGITFDAKTQTIPEIYNFYQDRHFGVNVTSTQERVPVPARFISHSFERLRSNQWRGIPLLAASLISLYEIEDLCTATVRAQTSASAITWVISEMNNAMRDPAGVAQLVGKRAPGDLEKQLVFDTTGGTAQYTTGKFNLVQSRDIGSNLVALLKEEYQKIATSLNMPYYWLTGDTSGLDFSSIRGLLASVRQNMQFIYSTILIPDVLRPVCGRFKELGVALRFPIEDAYPQYQFPRWYGVDDLKDAQADVLEVISGIVPIQAVWAERNYTEEQIAHSIETLKKLGLEGMLQNIPTGTQNNSNPTNNTSGS